MHPHIDIADLMGVQGQVLDVVHPGGVGDLIRSRFLALSVTVCEWSGLTRALKRCSRRGLNPVRLFRRMLCNLVGCGI